MPILLTYHPDTKPADSLPHATKSYRCHCEMNTVGWQVKYVWHCPQTFFSSDQVVEDSQWATVQLRFTCNVAVKMQMMIVMAMEN